MGSLNKGPLDDWLLSGFRLSAATALSVPVWLDGESERVVLRNFDHLPHEQIGWLTRPEGDRDLTLWHGGDTYTLAFSPPLSASAAGATSDGQLLAPMPGKVVQLAVRAGERVAKGAPVVTLEAMKMEHGMTAPFDAVVAEAPVSVGQQVAEGTLLVRLEAAED